MRTVRYQIQVNRMKIEVHKIPSTRRLSKKGDLKLRPGA